jgi:hypothetical protein
MMELVDQVAQELREYRNSPMAASTLAAHILAIPALKEAVELWRDEERRRDELYKEAERLAPNA